MALAKTIEITEIRVTNTWHVGVRTDTVIKEDDVEISRSPHRHVLSPFKSLKNGGSWTHTATDISSEDASVQSVCNAVWTNTVKNNYKAWAEANIKE